MLNTKYDHLYIIIKMKLQYKFIVNLTFKLSVSRWAILKIKI